MVVDKSVKPSAELTNIMRAKSSDQLSAADLDGNAIPRVHHGKPGFVGEIVAGENRSASEEGRFG